MKDFVFATRWGRLFAKMWGFLFAKIWGNEVTDYTAIATNSFILLLSSGSPQGSLSRRGANTDV